MSFSSPLYWQLQYIVQDCFSGNKKKSTSVEEIEQLTNLYGDDADTFLLKSLINVFRTVDINQMKSQKSTLNFFANKIDSLAISRSNFGNLFCEALFFDPVNDGSYPSVDKVFLDNFCNTFEVSVCTKVAIGVSVANSSRDVNVKNIGRDFLLSYVNDFDNWINVASDALCHDAICILKTFYMEKKTNDSNKNNNRSSSKIENIGKLISRLIEAIGNSGGVDSYKVGTFSKLPVYQESLMKTTTSQDVEKQVLSARNGNENDNSTNILLNKLSHQIQKTVEKSVAGIITDVGYAATNSEAALKEIISTSVKAGTSLNASDIANIILTMAQTQNQVGDEFAPMLNGSFKILKEVSANSKNSKKNISNSNNSSNNINKVDEVTSGNGWSRNVLVNVINELYMDNGAVGSWDDIIKAMDSESSNQQIADLEAFKFIAECYRLGCGKILPVKLFFGRWKNIKAQFVFLRNALNPQLSFDLIDFTEEGTGPNRQNIVNGSPSGRNENLPWCSIDLVATLLSLAQTELYPGVKNLLEVPMQECPDLLLTATCRVRPIWIEMKNQLLENLFPKVLGNQGMFVLDVLKLAWESDKEAVTNAFIAYHKQVPPKASIPKILKWCDRFEPGNQALHFILANTSDIGFVLELASSAHANDIINIANFFNQRLSNNSVDTFGLVVDKFGIPSINYLASKIGMYNGDANSSIPAAMMIKMIENLDKFPSPQDSEMKTKLRQIKHLAQRLPQLSGGNGMNNGNGGGNFERGKDNDIEEEANAYFQKIFTSQKSIAEIVDMLENFKNSSEDRKRRVFFCMVRNLLDEYRFFHKYPEKELRITGELFGTLINRNLLAPPALAVALKNVHEAISKPPQQTQHNTKMFLFGYLALQQFKGRLREWPDYCKHLIAIPHLRQSYPDMVNEIVSMQTANGQGNTGKVDEKSQGINSTNLASGFENLSLSSGNEAPMTMEKFLGFNSDNQTEEMKPEPPPADVVDQLQFIINNLSIQNMESKLKEVKEALKPEFTAWFADFLVEKRVIGQANYHKLYMLFIEKLEMQELDDEVLRISFRRAKKLLAQKRIVTEANDRTLLKNLGNYIGIATLSRNKPVLYVDLDLKELLYLAYEEGKLIAVAPFIAKVLEGAQVSNVFMPPNPWLMAIMRAMRELYDVPDLKLKLKFEVEVLCKHLNIKVEEIKASTYLPNRRKPVMRDNPDFNAKAVERAIAAEAAAAKAASETKNNSRGATNDNNKPVIPNLHKYVNITMDIPGFAGEAALGGLVTLALDRAIREIIQPVVERSVSIACITSQNLVKKDFAMEWDENKMKNAAHLMVANLAGNLSLVTCKDPLRNSMTKLLRDLITKQQAAGNIPKEGIERIVQQCVNDNLKLGCSLIEKAATEKAKTELDSRLSNQYNIRRATREQRGQQYYDMSIFNARSRYPAALPEILRPKPGGLQNHQYMVYSMFERKEGPSLPANVSAGNSNKGSVAIGGVGNNANWQQQNNAPVDRNVLPQQQQPNQGNRNLPAPHLIAKQAVEQIYDLMSKMDNIIRTNNGANLLADGSPAAIIVGQVAQIIQLTVVVDREAAVLNFAQQVVSRLFDRSQDSLTIRLYIACVAVVKNACKPLVATLTNWVIASNFLDLEVIPELLRVQLINHADFDNYVYNMMKKGNKQAVDYAQAFLQKVILQKKVSDASRLPRMMDGLKNIAEKFGDLYPNLNKFLAELQASGGVPATGGNASTMQQRQQQQQQRPGNVQNFQVVSGTEGIQVRDELTRLLVDWTAVVESCNAETSYVQLMRLLQSRGILKDDNSTTSFFRVCTEICVQAYINGGADNSNYKTIDAFAKLIVLVIKFSTPRDQQNVQNPQNPQLILLNKVLLVVAQVLLWHESTAGKRASEGGNMGPQNIAAYQYMFSPKPYFRIFVSLMEDLTIPDPALVGGSSTEVILQFANALHAIRPQIVPGFAFAWLELVSHRSFVPKLLISRKQMKCWNSMHVLIVDLLQYMEPYLSGADLSDSAGIMYKGLLRFMMLLLHDFPEFFCDYHFNLCEYIPNTSIQLRNLVLSAFPRNMMRLPDPFSSNLKVDSLPGINQPPIMLSSHVQILEKFGFLEDIKKYLKTRAPATFLDSILDLVLLRDAKNSTTRYNVPIMNALVLYTGSVASSSNSASVERQASVAMFDKLLKELDTEGRYLFLNGIANQLRYPNLHTYYFSCILLYLFAEAGRDVKLKEQITRVLLERLIVHRPHPWGLLITFIELIKNQRYQFWSHEFTQCHPDIKRLFESVAASCMIKPR
jgi:CCR4-NOT transcription complex subunit 1